MNAERQVELPEAPGKIFKNVALSLYVVFLCVAIFFWVRSIGFPLWLDETGSYWQISAGFKQIWPRLQNSLSFPAYTYILWLFTRILGSSEIALRVPSLLAALAALWFFYRTARELFDREMAWTATVLFGLNTIMIRESIDARPYAFGILSVNIALYLLVQIRRKPTYLKAVLLGVMSALIMAFHFLMGIVLPALLIAYFLWSDKRNAERFRQLAVALCSFLILFLPLLPGLYYMFHTAKNHVFETPPTYAMLGIAMSLPIAFWGMGLLYWLIADRKSASLRSVTFNRNIAIYILTGLLPLLIFFAVSRYTDIHTFVARHRLMTVPGLIFLAVSALLLIPHKKLRVIASLCLLAGNMAMVFPTYYAGSHFYSFKEAIQIANAAAGPDASPILICSDFPEADYASMPNDNPKESPYFAPLSYYKIPTRVVPLPRALNDEAQRVVLNYLEEPDAKSRKFIAMGYGPSYPTLRWIEEVTSADFTMKVLGSPDNVVVLEFTPIAR